MILSLKGLALGIALFAVIWVAICVIYAARLAARTGGTVDLVSLLSHSGGPVFWLTLVVTLGLGCLIVIRGHR